MTDPVGAKQTRLAPDEETGLQEAPGGLLMQGRREGNGDGARLNGSRHATALSWGRVRVVRNP
ncbi:hypothetical protein CRG98_027723 [Punica granatum]|uniref:Uncharacterized protein n=1 Tax=Punica granatum TaxID=22663 RepID=A0A2I0J7M3_PUNGR|nr:hypothetical protein CRG98_027723 [Punica granatum]